MRLKRFTVPESNTLLNYFRYFSLTSGGTNDIHGDHRRVVNAPTAKLGTETGYPVQDYP
jgi:hypothetical protein